MSQTADKETTVRRPRTWVLWVVRAALALTVLHIGIGAIASIWLGQSNSSFLWLVMALPQVSIALIAVLICWDPKSRPQNLGITVVMLNLYGLMAALASLRWLPVAIGALTVVAMVVRPRNWIYSDPPPARFGWLRR